MRVAVVLGALALSVGCSTTTGGEAVSGGGAATGASGSEIAIPTEGSAPQSAPQSVPTSEPAGGGTATVGAMTVTLPTGVQYTPHTPGGQFDGCLSSAQAACQAKLQDLRPLLNDPQAQFNKPSAKRQFGWYTGTDVPECVARGSGPGSVATGSSLVRSGFASVGPKRAEYAVWRVRCTDPSQNGRVRMWWLPRSAVLIVQYSGADVELDDMLASATFR